jgi:two-component system response regulator FlrC
MGQPEARLSETTRRLLSHYPWPGNVRELENAIQRGLLLCDGHWIEPEDMALDHHSVETMALHDARGSSVPSFAAKNGATPQERPLEGLLPSSGRTVDRSTTKAPQPELAPDKSEMSPLGAGLDDSKAATVGIRTLEREHILKVLHQVGGSRKRAVEILGISERTLRYKLKLWRESGIQVP